MIVTRHPGPELQPAGRVGWDLGVLGVTQHQLLRHPQRAALYLLLKGGHGVALAGVSEDQENVCVSDALLGPASEGGDLVTLVDHRVVVILLGPQPGAQLEVVAGVQGVEAEVGLDEVRGDGDGGAEVGETEDQLLGDVLQGNPVSHRDHGHSGVTTRTCTVLWHTTWGSGKRK